MRTYSDATLEHYADRFMGLRLSRHGVSLEQYLANPERFERLALEPEPLLAAQQAAALRLWWGWDTGLGDSSSQPEHAAELPPEYAAWEEFLLGLGNKSAIRQRNGAFIEPLHHHRHNARNRNANFARKGA